jgi:serine/threonine protein kinase/WD40 repeat protein
VAAVSDDSDSMPDELAPVTEDFLARWRRGERPSPEEYAAAHPGLARHIRELFPALLLVEEDARRCPPAGPPEVLGDYRILREVGRGGMGVVYEAEQTSLGRRVALKVLPPERAAAGTFRERFLREARAAARLHHTNIVPVFASGEHDGTLFFAMQFIDGKGLEAVLDDVRRLRAEPTPPGSTRPDGPTPASLAHDLLTGSFPAAPAASDTTTGATDATPAPSSPVSGTPYIREVARLALQAAEALACAHGQGIVHRDVKPSNLMLDAAGHLWMTDFGLAKAEDADELTSPGELVGTLRYLAPERFAGRCDALSDVYALGVTLYELLTLRPAFDAADRLRLIEQIRQGAPPRPRRLQPELPLDLETIVLKAMAADPAQRYAAAAELADDLRRFLADQPIRARQASKAERLRRWARRNPTLAALSAAVAALLVLTAAGAVLWALTLGRALSQSEERLWQARLEQARANRRSGRVGQRVDSLRLLEEAARMRVTPELRNEVIACLALIDLEEAASLPRVWAADATVVRPGLPRGRLAEVDGEGVVHIRSLPDGREVAHLDGRGPALLGSPWFSPDGRFVVTLDYPWRRLRLWDLRGEEPRLVFEEPSGSVDFRGSFRPDGRQVALQYRDGSIHVHDTSTGELRVRTPIKVVNGPFRFHPHLPQLAYARDGDVHVMDLDRGVAVHKLAHPQTVAALAWSPSGKQLAVGRNDGKIYLWDTEPWGLRLTVEGYKGLPSYRPVPELSFHPSGRVLYGNGSDGRERLWDAESGQLLLNTPRPHADWVVTGELLLPEPSRDRLRLDRLVERRVLRLIPARIGGNTAPITGLVLDPEGRWLAVATGPGGKPLQLFDLWDPEGVPAPLVGLPLGFDSSGALLTWGQEGLTRWPFASAGAGVRRLGPPQVLTRHEEGFFGWSYTPDCSLWATGSATRGSPLFRLFRKGEVLHRGPPRVDTLERAAGTCLAALSPDGRWLATVWDEASRSPPGTQVWDAASGRHVKDLPSSQGRRIAFSPDSRWLGVQGTDRVWLWHTGTWEVGPATGEGRFAFSPDGLMAVAEGGALRLVELETGREVARLEAPDEPGQVPVSFSADGSVLMAGSDSTQTVLLWDLRALREELAARGLDWDRPPYPPAPPRNAAPVRIEVDQGKPAR